MKILKSRFGLFLLHNCRQCDVSIREPDEHYYPVVLHIDERNFILAKFEDRADAKEYKVRLEQALLEFLLGDPRDDHLDLEEVHYDTMELLSCYVPPHLEQNKDQTTETKSYKDVAAEASTFIYE